MKVISRKNFPARLPFYDTIIAGLLLDRLDAAGWVWGMFATFFILVWIGAIQAVNKQTQVNVIKE